MNKIKTIDLEKKEYSISQNEIFLNKNNLNKVLPDNTNCIEIAKSIINNKLFDNGVITPIISENQSRFL